jgi:hypothetical protein
MIPDISAQGCSTRKKNTEYQVKSNSVHLVAALAVSRMLPGPLLAYVLSATSVQLDILF